MLRTAICRSKSPRECNFPFRWAILTQRLFTSASLRHAGLPSTNQALNGKPYYVTSPIFYVNAAPHVGHLYTLVLADVLKRWHVLQGQDSILCTGTDEHGMKVQRAAAKADIDVSAFCDESFKPFKELADEANVDYTRFIRTTDADHRSAVQHFWLLLQEQDLIYTKKHQGWYSVSDECYYTQKAVGLTLDPQTGRKFMASRETGSEVEWTEEDNYHFKMSEMQQRLLDYYRANPDFVVPNTRMKEVVSEVTAGLQDLSISRPADRLTWGIPVPNDKTQTIYVWVDALINYLTMTGFPQNSPEIDKFRGWPADCHVVGKDIIRFHAIYWPALLLAVGLQPPRKILSHAHWLLGEAKMSKSRGTVVNAFFALDRFGTDAMRWYLVLEGGIKDDAAYDNRLINDKYRKGLQGGLGNLVSRMTRSRIWSIREAVQSHDVGAQYSEPSDCQVVECLQKLPSAIAQYMDRPNPGDALATIMNVIYDANVYIHQQAPWHLKGHEHKDRRNAVIFLIAEIIRICGILLQPFMPGKMKHLLDMLGVDQGSRLIQHAVFGQDRSYGTPTFDLTLPHAVLFEPPRSLL